MTSENVSLEEMEKFVIRHKDLPNRVSPVRLQDMVLPQFERKRYPVTGYLGARVPPVCART